MYKYLTTLLCILVFALPACRSLPNLEDRTESVYIPTKSAPKLEALLQLPKRGAAPPNAYVYILDQAYDAFIARSALIEHAQFSLDLQYYIWRNDLSGGLLLKQLWAAAKRGVRVRLLLDDNNTGGNDAILAALDSHPNIEVRLFNPFLYRKWRFIGYITDFSRLNRRMHNKSFTADNRVTVIGGRNIGDEYFNSNSDTSFSDMDVLVAGNVVNQVSADFDRYWQSDSAYPLKQIIQTSAVNPAIFSEPPNDEQVAFLMRASNEPLAKGLHLRSISLIPAQTRLVSDDPAKALDKHVRSDIIGDVHHALHVPKQDIYLVSPYFVPTRKGMEILKNFSNHGVNITVFTNSLQATDVTAVHSGYARYRKPLLHAGVNLYEFKPTRAVPKYKYDRGLTGSSATSLHAKTFIIDQKRIFIGSLNLDPRSARLNTEMGLVINNEKLARYMHQKLQYETQTSAYRVGLNEQGRIQWYDPDNNETLHQEPDAGFWKRFFSRILSILPIERLL